MLQRLESLVYLVCATIRSAAGPAKSCLPATPAVCRITSLTPVDLQTRRSGKARVRLGAVFKQVEDPSPFPNNGERAVRLEIAGCLHVIRARSRGR